MKAIVKTLIKSMLAAGALAASSAPFAQVTFFQDNNFQGSAFTTQRAVGDFQRFGFNDRASSVVVTGQRWEVCDGQRFSGQCVVLRPGRYPSLAAMGLNDRVSSVRAVSSNARVGDERYAPLPVTGQGSAQVVFYENENYQGRSFTAQTQIEDFTRYGFNDRASSVVVLGDRWEACNDVRFGGRCVVLRPGRYPSLAAMGMNDRVSSVRDVGYDDRISDERYAPPPTMAYDNRRRNNEQLYTVNVSSVRAVTGPAEQRCWNEAAPVDPARAAPNVGAAIVGGLLGGILGHQVGGGTGKTVATLGGAAAGAALGGYVIGRGEPGQATTQNVQRCGNASGQPGQVQPAYYDVTYSFRGQEHHAQMTSAPGPTLTVNGQGEPRV
ncbi:MAG: beta/gamma crystallin-related protein [Polaromonas sp.]